MVMVVIAKVRVQKNRVIKGYQKENHRRTLNQQIRIRQKKNKKIHRLHPINTILSPKIEITSN